MKLIKFLLLTLCFSASLGCNQTVQQTKRVSKVDTNKGSKVTSTPLAFHTDTMIIDSVIERKIFDTIFKLKEIKREAKDIERLSKWKRHLSLVIQDTPHLPERDYYWVRACEDNGFSFATYFHFYIYPDSMRIMYYDPASDSILTLEKWRKTNGM